MSNVPVTPRRRVPAPRGSSTPPCWPLAALLLVAASACGDATPRPRPPTRSSTHHDATTPTGAATDARASTAGVAITPPRRAIPGRPEQRWTRGGSERDTLLAYARQAVADERNVYLLDSGRDRVVALRAADGTTAWQYGVRDGGSRVARRLAPTAIAILPGGGVAVADATRHAILLLDPAGRLVGTVSLPADVGAPRTLCALSTSRFLAADPDSAGRVMDLRRDAPARRLPLPWPDLAGRPRLTTQIWLAGSAAAPRCAIALVLGRGFALYDGTAYSAPRPYVQPFDLPTVTRTTRGDSARRTIEERLSTDRVAATDVALDGDRVAVLFAGESALRSRLVDLYDARTGDYAGSAAFPHRISAIAAHGRHYYLLHQRGGRPAVTALTLPPDSSLTRR